MCSFVYVELQNSSNSVLHWGLISVLIPWFLFGSLKFVLLDLYPCWLFWPEGYLCFVCNWFGSCCLKVVCTCVGFSGPKVTCRRHKGGNFSFVVAIGWFDVVSLSGVTFSGKLLREACAILMKIDKITGLIHNLCSPVVWFFVFVYVDCVQQCAWWIIVFSILWWLYGFPIIDISFPTSIISVNLGLKCHFGKL